MTPQRDTPATLVDLLDRVLDKGLVIQADLIVSVAGIPLIGVSLRAALAGMETMLDYGVMREWDESIRNWERDARQEKCEMLLHNETLLKKLHGSCYSNDGLFNTWECGCFYLTSKRLVLYHDVFNSVLFEVAFQDIMGLTLYRQESGTNQNGYLELHLLLKKGRGHRLRAMQVEELKEGLLKSVLRGGFSVETLPNDVTETCPGCGYPHMRQRLLEAGCGECGWTSPAGGRQIAAVL